MIKKQETKFELQVAAEITSVDVVKVKRNSDQKPADADHSNKLRKV